MLPSSLPRQTLLFDADDTLWENNVYFERAVAAFISYLDHRVHTPEEVREHLNICERASVAAHGYGIASFLRSLVACFEQLSHLPITPENHDRIVSFAKTIGDHQIELLPFVPEVLKQLSTRHLLILVTKGNTAEQTAKLKQSGLRSFFSGVEVLHEKNVAAYRGLIRRYNCNPADTWMIGNSPRSDINPALAAGLHAVFIPHDQTWILEQESLDGAGKNQRLVELPSFAALLEHF